jgi:nucleotide-binding universal stress UspA family protein
MFKKIYVPIDNSDISEKILVEALTFAKAANAELRISHVVNFEQITFGIEMVGVAELKDTLTEIANKFVMHTKEKMRTLGFDINITLLENYGGDLASLIVDDAKKWGADLFVLGSHHLGSFSHFITGGVVEDIAHDCEIPILLFTKHKQKN